MAEILDFPPNPMGDTKKNYPNYTTGEMFCGAGGLTRGFHGQGFQPLFANDLWKPALHTFMMNFDEDYAKSGGKSYGEILPISGSIEDVKPTDILGRLSSKLPTGELDVLLGGPPCQGFSVNAHSRSSKDPRNHLFKHYVRILRGIAPKIFVLENVPGMFSFENGTLFDELISSVTSNKPAGTIGYDVDYKIVNAAHYGVPQERFRIVVIGTRRDVAEEVGKVRIPLPLHYSFAQAHFKGGRSHTFHYAIGHADRSEQDVIPLTGIKLLAPISVADAISDLPAQKNGSDIGDDVLPYSCEPRSEFQKSMRKGSAALYNHWCRELMPPNTERAKHIPVGGDWRSIPRQLLPPGMQRAKRKDHTTRYGRLDPQGLAGTLLTKPDPHWGTFLHYDLSQQRLISVREAARFQSFPDKHVFYGSQVDQYRLCGNAVPPLMAAAIANEVRTVLDRLQKTKRVRARA